MSFSAAASARVLCLGGLLAACAPAPRGGEGEECNREAVERDGFTQQVGVCDEGLTCVEYDFECGLGPPGLPCQNEECLDCDDPQNRASCPDE